jgi:copper/silver efflux system protein
VKDGLTTAVVEWSARNRALVLLAIVFAVGASIQAIRAVKLDAIPDLSDPQVIVFSEWRGRSPTLMEDQVTYPIVSALLAAPRVTDVRGFSMFGMSFVHVLFEEGTDVYWARSRVLELLSTVRDRLPESATTKLGPDATGVGWVFQYALVDESGAHGLDELRAFQDFTLRYALGAVPGVAEVASVGGYEKQYQIVVDPNRLRAYGIGVDEVARRVRESSGDVGGRVLEMTGREYYVRGSGYATRLEDLEKIALRAVGPQGAPVLVRDVATVRFGPDLRRGLMEWNGRGEAVGGIVVMRTGENALDVIERVRAKLGELAPALPKGVRVEVAYDRSDLVERSIGTLARALIEEAIVVALVILIFLLHARSSLLPILSLPLAVALAFVPMVLLDIPSTIMSLGGIAIAIGATVDAEIVMIEACHKKLEHAPPGADRRALLAEAARETTPAIFFSLLIIAVAFLPVFALEGQAGRLFKPLAYTKTFVMLFSALLSITFAPAMRDLLLRGRFLPEHRHPISRAMIRLYRPFVFVALRNPRSTIAIGLLAVISAAPLAANLGREFMPPLDEGDLLYMPITFPNISIEEAKRQLQAQDQVLRAFPEVASVFGKIGRAETATDPAPITMVETTVRLKPVEERPLVDGRRRTTAEIAAAMNDAMRFPGWTAAFTQPIRTRVDMLTTGIRTPIGVKVFGTDLASIERVGLAIERLLAPVPGTRSVLYERALGGLYVDVVPDRDALARYGATIEAVQSMVETAIGGAPVTTTIEGRARFTVSVRVPQDQRGDVEALRELPVRLGDAYVPLGTIASVRIVGGPPMVRDEDGLLVGYVYVDVDPARDVGGYARDAQAVVDGAIAAGTLALPPGTFLKWTGQYELLAQMVAKMKVLVPATLFLIVLLLFLHFRSFAKVLIVLLSLPFALVGSVWLLFLLDYRVSTAVWVGGLALAGLAAQTGVVMLVYIDNVYEEEKRQGRIHDLSDIVRAHMEGVVMRVRPKVMTVLTMLLGLVPLLWATGSGADVMKRIAAPMVGGLVTSAFLTLEIIPVVSTYWRQEELLFERLATLDPAALRRLRTAAWTAFVGLVALASVAVSTVYVTWPAAPLVVAAVVALLVALGGAAAYVAARPAARRIVWPAPQIRDR